MTYEEFSARLEERAKKHRRRQRVKDYIIYGTLYKFLPFLALLTGTTMLQLGWGQYKLVNMFWGLCAIALGVTIWCVIDDARIDMDEWGCEDGGAKNVREDDNRQRRVP